MFGQTGTPVRLAYAALLAAAFLGTGCASRNAVQSEPNPDPLEAINRPMFKFNDVADRFVIRPVAWGYRKIFPRPIRTGVSNFFDNLTYPVTIVNQFLQGKFAMGFRDTGRLLLNSTLGFAGFLDPATDAGLRINEEDFGQTMAVWGIPQGPYLILPLLGPRSMRDAVGIPVNVLVNPVMQWPNSSQRSKLFILWTIETRAGLIGPDKAIREAFDPYLFVRDAYLQNREFLIYDGNPPEADLGDFEDEFDENFGEDFEDEFE